MQGWRSELLSLRGWASSILEASTKLFQSDCINSHSHQWHVAVDLEGIEEGREKVESLVLSHEDPAICRDDPCKSISCETQVYNMYIYLLN